MIPTLLSLDPAEAAGWSFFVDGKLEKYGTARGAFWHTMVEDMSKQLIPDTKFCFGQVVIEQGWLNRSKGAITLSQRRGIAQSAAEFFGFRRITYVGASTWQHALGYRRGGDPKKFSLDFVRNNYQIEAETDDISDSICLGHYFLHARTT